MPRLFRKPLPHMTLLDGALKDGTVQRTIGEDNQMTDIGTNEAESQVLTIEPLPVHRLRYLIKNRKLTKKYSQTEEFAALVSGLEEVLANEEATSFYLGLSIAGRAASDSKPMELVFNKCIADRLQSPMPSFVVLQDGEDRRYLAKALQVANPATASDLAYSELVREDAKEKARKTWAEIAFAAAVSREELLFQINRAISHVFGHTKSRSDSMARRIRRIIAAIKDNLILSDLPAGPEYGTQLRTFFVGHFTDEGPEDKKLRNDYAHEVIAALIDVSRLSLPASSDPHTYDVVKEIKYWWQPAAAPATIESLGRKLAQSGLETLLVFARQGHRNEPLRRSIVESVGHHNYEKLANTLIGRDGTLTEDMATWVITGGNAKSRRSSEVVEALSSEQVNEDMSRLLIYLTSPETSSAEIASLTQEIEDLMPEQAGSLQAMGKRLKQVVQVVSVMAKRNNVHLFLGVGDIVQFDPAQYEPVGDIAVGRSCLVARSGTRLKEPGRPERIIIKPRVRSA